MSQPLLTLSIVTPRSTAFTGDVLAVSVPGSQSPFQVLYNHAPIISALDIGIIKIHNEDNSSVFYATKTGFVEVLKNTVNIVVEEILVAQEIDVSKAESAFEESKAIADSNADRFARDRARVDMQWAETQLRAARLMAEA